MKALHRAISVTIVASAMLVALPQTGSADTPAPSTYRQAVKDAYDIVASAAPGDITAAQRATDTVEQGTGATQPEILADLASRPPNFQDAAARLLALLDALDHPAATSDPQSAVSKLHDVMSMSRYDALHRPPSLLDRLGQWLGDRIAELLRLLFGNPKGIGGIVPIWVIYVIGVLMMGAVAFFVFRSTRGRLSGGFAADGPSGPRAPADYFAEADRFAAKGDHVAAIRALCAGVAATLAGERTWEGSPLTVREIFMRAPEPWLLRPLLLPFEAAVYGGRDVDAATYEQAAAVAAQFRAPVENAA